MGGVYCPTCEAGVEVTAKFCLSCGHDLTGQGPITATGHDLNQLKDVIRMRSDLSMAEKFDMIAQVEDGANPITLGIAAPAEGDDGSVQSAPAQATPVAEHLASVVWGGETADVFTGAALEGTSTAKKWKSKSFGNERELFNEAMDLGRAAAIKVVEVSQEVGDLLGNPVVASVPIMRPPTKSFCPKCGSDIHANALLQWKKWGAATETSVAIQLEASMTAALMHAAEAYLDKIQDLKDQLEDAKTKLKKPRDAPPAETASTSDSTSAPASETTSDDGEPSDDSNEKSKATSGKGKAGSGTGKAGSDNGKSSTPAGNKKATSTSKPKPKSGGGLFGAKKAKKTYDGEPGGKAEWFLEKALDTVYDPHGTGKAIKGATILARSAEGNVRVRDVIRAYADEGEAGISELAKTSPLTKYLIEAFDAC